MADIPNREELEAELARVLSSALSRQLKELMTYLGDPPDLRNVPARMWEEHKTELNKAVRPFLEKVYLAQGQTFLEGAGVGGVDWALANTAASDWARGYSFELVKGIVDGTTGAVDAKLQGLLRDTIAEGIDTGISRREVADLLAPIFGPVRAEMIAVTETTRAAAQGEAGIVAGLAENGIRMTAYWNTVEDEAVCPICEPRDGRAQEDGWEDLPPAHPRCRCFVTHKVTKEDPNG